MEMEKKIAIKKAALSPAFRLEAPSTNPHTVVNDVLSSCGT